MYLYLRIFLGLNITLASSSCPRSYIRDPYISPLKKKIENNTHIVFSFFPITVYLRCEDENGFAWDLKKTKIVSAIQKQCPYRVGIQRYTGGEPRFDHILFKSSHQV